jgi:voltage-gated sodium channel
LPGIKVTIYFVTFILFGTMIILNLFIGIIMNSMSEMHAGMAERDRAQHERETGSAALADELRSLEREMKEMQTRLVGLRRKWSGESRRPESKRNAEEGAA